MAKHPESGEPILAGIGRYGSYVQHKKTYANLGKDDDVLEIGGNRAIDLIMTKEAGGGFGGSGGEIRSIGEHPEGGAGFAQGRAVRALYRLGQGQRHAAASGTDMTGLTLERLSNCSRPRRRARPADGRVLGEHPDGGKIAARAGRFGPYVSWEKVNATLPKNVTLEDVSLELAIRLIEDRIAAGGAQGPEEAGEKSPGQESRRQENFGQEACGSREKVRRERRQGESGHRRFRRCSLRGRRPGKKAGAEKDGSQEVGASVRPERSDFGRMARTLPGKARQEMIEHAVDPAK